MFKAVSKPNAANDDGPGSLHNHRVANKGRGIVGKGSICNASLGGTIEAVREGRHPGFGEMGSGGKAVDSSEEALMVFAFRDDGEVIVTGVSIGIVGRVRREERASDEVVNYLAEVHFPPGGVGGGVDGEPFLVGEVQGNGVNLGVMN